MSRENVEIVRAAYDHLNRGDVEALVKLCDDDFVIDMSERVFNPDTYRGPDGLRRFYEGVREVWESYRWGLEETFVAGDLVVAMLHCEGQGREGGVQVDWHPAWLWRFRRGTPVSACLFRDHTEAIEAAGLQE